MNLAFSQKVNINGFIKNSKKIGPEIEIIVNDTLNRLIKSGNKNYPDYEKLFYDENFRIIADVNGEFEINVKLSDSIYFSSWEHITESYLVSDLLKKEKIEIELKPEPCEKYIPCKEKPRKLYVFIGKKIKVDYSDYIKYCDMISMDIKYDAEYKIIENLYGNFPRDTIKFVSYDHASKKRYDEYDTVLLYVTEYCGNLIHVKYQYHDLYKTTEGKWASPYNSRNYHNVDSTFSIKPRKIDFEKPIEFQFDEKNIEFIKEKYPEPYFKISNGKVKTLYGNYPNELFELKKMNSLKDKGFFE
jgi:hypothetical protein